MEDDVAHRPVQSKNPVPWETCKPLRIVDAFALTVLKVLFSPMKFFAQSEFKGKTAPSLSFGVTVLVIVATMFVLGLVSLGAGLAPLAGTFWFRYRSLVPWLLAASPVILWGVLAAAAWVFHAASFMAGGRKGFAATCRAVSYSSAALLISAVVVMVWIFMSLFWNAMSSAAGVLIYVLMFAMIPLGVFARIWPLVVVTLALKHLHEISFGRAIAAVVIALCILTALFYGVIIASAFLCYSGPAQSFCPIR